MMSEERSLTGRINDPGGSSDVAFHEMTLEALGISNDKVPKAKGRVCLGRVACRITVEERDKRLAVHE